MGILCKHVKGFTIYEATGYYNGTREKSLVVDIFGTTRDVVDNIAQELLKTCRQESVGVIEIPYTGGLVFSDEEVTGIPV